MRDKWKNNLALKIIALLFAVFLWWLVANVDDPITTKKFNAEVSVLNPEIITNIGKSYQIVDNTKSVIITVKARRSVVEAIRSRDLQVTADFRELQDSFIPIRVKINGYEGMYEEATSNPRNIQVQTEDTQKKTFPIAAVTVGSVSQGYVLGEVTAKPQSIDISGPKSSIGRISKVVAKVDVSGLSEDATLSAEVIYYDSADNIIDKTQLSSNCDKNGVKVKVELLETKKVDLSFDTSEISVASGYVFKEITVEPQQITISGSAKQLDDVDTIAVGSKALRQKNLKQSKEVVVDITGYLPEGVMLADENNSSVVVNIIVEKNGTKSLLLPVRSVKVNHAPEDMELTYGPDQEIELLFQGSEENLKKLTANNVIASVDLAAYTEEGTYNVTVQMIDMPEGCTYIGEASVQITLSRKQE